MIFDLYRPHILRATRSESNLVVCMYRGGKGKELLPTMCNINEAKKRYCTKNLTTTAFKRIGRGHITTQQRRYCPRKTVSTALFRAHQSHQRERHNLRQGIGPDHFLVLSQSVNGCPRRPRYLHLRCRRRTTRRSTIPRNYLTELGLCSIRRAKGWVQSDSTVPSVASRQTMLRAIHHFLQTWEPWLAQ